MLSSTVIGEVIHPRSKLAGYSTGNKSPHVQIFAALDMLDSKRK
jgi:hypothetical protein